jgi:hypothetical protein
MNFKYLSVTPVTPIFTASGTLERLNVQYLPVTYKVRKSRDPALYLHFFLKIYGNIIWPLLNQVYRW